LVCLVAEVNCEEDLNFVGGWHDDPKLFVLSVWNFDRFDHLSVEGRFEGTADWSRQKILFEL